MAYIICIPSISHYPCLIDFGIYHLYSFYITLSLLDRLWNISFVFLHKSLTQFLIYWQSLYTPAFRCFLVYAKYRFTWINNDIVIMFIYLLIFEWKNKCVFPFFLELIWIRILSTFLEILQVANQFKYLQLVLDFCFKFLTDVFKV